MKSVPRCAPRRLRARMSSWRSPRLGTAQELASQLAAFQPHLVHLSGPCRSLRRCPRCHRRSPAHSERCPACRAGLGEVMPAPCFGFEDAGMDEHWVDASELRAMLAARGVRCVWLTDWQPDTFRGAGAARLCEALACAELPFAIGWSCSLGASGAARLAANVYAALAAGLPVDAALARARAHARRASSFAAPGLAVAVRRGRASRLDHRDNRRIGLRCARARTGTWSARHPRGTRGRTAPAGCRMAGGVSIGRITHADAGG